MVDIEIFLIYLFVLVDDFCKAHPFPSRPGPDWNLSASEAITLLLFGQWARFRSERDFYRFAEQKLRSAFPNLPTRPQLNRQWQALQDQVCAFSIYLSDLLGAQEAPYEALDLLSIVIRDAKRRGTGWLTGEADIGKSNRLGWYEGFKVPLAVTPKGVITGFGLAPASAKEQPIAETFFYLRAYPNPRFVSIGHTGRGRYYPVDKGFEGRENRQRWQQVYGARVIYPPKRNSRRP